MIPQVNHIRQFAALAIALITVFASSAKDVSYQQALSTAADFFKSKGLDVTPSAMRRAKAPAASDNINSPYYIINQDNAFAIVAGDSRVTPILAYSLDGNFDDADTPPAVEYLLQMYEDYIMGLAEDAEPVQTHNLPALTQSKCLQTATWDQGREPWWDKCPVKPGYTRPCWAGCVATAMSIIMRYHCWPQSTGYGSKTYTTVINGFECSADFGNTDYKIATLPTTAYEIENGTPEQKDAIATLLYHAGVAANMEYDVDGSGATDMQAFMGICRYFGYKYGGWAVRSDYTSDDDYLLDIVNEIDANRPLMYSGQSESGGGHMFVCDGYDQDYRLHFNFGWSGSLNGYYSIFETDMTYYKWQSAIFGIRPDPNAATATHPSLYFAESGDAHPHISINSRTGNAVYLSIDRLYNMTDGPLKGISLSLRICDADGNVKTSIYNREGISLDYDNYWALLTYVYLPSDYIYAAGDRAYLYYSEDGGNTWQVIERYERDNYLDMAILYDPTLADLKMLDRSGDCPGLHVVNDYTINNNAVTFKVCPGNLYNYTYVDFDGEVAIYLCDSSDRPKKMVSDAKACQLNVNLYKSNFYIDCKLQPTDKLQSGDRLVAFCRPTGAQEWSMIECDEEDKYYITLPASLMPTSQTVAFNGLFATFSSDYDLDFAAITDYYAYTVTMLDSETLALNRITSIPMGEGVLLMGNNGAANYSGNASILSTKPASPAENLLIGVLEDTVISNDDSDDGTNYVFKTSPDTGFYLAGGETVNAGTAYMRIPGSVHGAPVRFVFISGENQNGVFSVIADTLAADAIYNLQGMKVTRPGRGLYIIGGKKVFIR